MGIYKNLYASDDDDCEKIEKNVARKEALFLEFFEKETPPIIEGALELIKNLKSNNVPILIITNAPQQNALAMLKASLKQSSKDLNDNVDANETVFFEDSNAGMKAGQKLGCYVVAIGEHNDVEYSNVRVENYRDISTLQQLETLLSQS